MKKLGPLVAALTALALYGCDEKREAPQHKAKVATHVAGSPLALKDLTTGVKYDEDSFPKLLVRTNNEISFYYEYFGKAQLVTAELDSEGTVYLYEILLKGDQTALRTAIEQKVSTENGQEIKFECTTDNQHWGGMRWTQSTCTIVSGTQRLIVEERAPTSRRPSTASDSVWASMHMSKLLLKDVELADRDAKGSAEREGQRRREQEAKARSDV